jgi:hypothetical protein
MGTPQCILHTQNIDSHDHAKTELQEMKPPSDRVK